jgi:hypothetical protein
MTIGAKWISGTLRLISWIEDDFSLIVFTKWRTISLRQESQHLLSEKRPMKINSSLSSERASFWKSESSLTPSSLRASTADVEGRVVWHISKISKLKDGVKSNTRTSSKRDERCFGRFQVIWENKQRQRSYWLMEFVMSS